MFLQSKVSETLSFEETGILGKDDQHAEPDLWPVLKTLAPGDTDSWAGPGGLVILPGASDLQGEPAVGRTGVRPGMGVRWKGQVQTRKALPVLEKHLDSDAPKEPFAAA